MKTKAVFIDDDDLMHLVWSQDAQRNNIALTCYKNPLDFIKEKSNFPFSTHIYIDSNLKLARKGEEFAKDIFEQGFKTIYLASGYTDIDIKAFPWIKCVIGKRPNFSKEIK